MTHREGEGVKGGVLARGWVLFSLPELFSEHVSQSPGDRDWACGKSLRLPPHVLVSPALHFYRRHRELRLTELSSLLCAPCPSF